MATGSSTATHPPVAIPAPRRPRQRPAHRAPAAHNRWLVLAALVVPLTVIVLDTTVLNLALTSLADPVAGLGASSAQLQWVVNAYTLTFAGLLLSFGILADRYGRRRLLLIGVTIFGVSSFVAAYSPDPTLLILTRAVMGIGSAAVMPTSLSLVTTVFEPSERARALGIWSASVGLGAAAGPAVGGLLLNHFWWGSVFLLNVPVAVLAVVAVRALVPESVNDRHDKIDVVGVVLSVAAVALLAYGVVEAGQRGFTDPTVLTTLAASGLLFVAFTRHARSCPYPALDIRLFHKPQFSASAGVVLLIFGANWGVLFFSTFYLQLVRGLSTQEAGLIMLPFALAQVLVSPCAPALVRLFGAKQVCVVGMLLAAGTFAGYALVEADTSLWFYGMLEFLQGASLAIVATPALDSIIGSVPREKAGAASAVFQVSRQVATALGISVIGSVVTAIYRSTLTRDLPSLTADQRASALESVSAGYATAKLLGPVGLAVTEAVERAFIGALHAGSGVAAGLAGAGAAIALGALPSLATSVGQHVQPRSGIRSGAIATLRSLFRRSRPGPARARTRAGAG